MEARQVLEFAEQNQAKIVDLRFIDVPGLWQHFSIPASDLSEELTRHAFYVGPVVKPRRSS